MRMCSVRPLMLAAALLALALPATGLAGVQGARTDRGVIQSIDPARVVLRALDGSIVSFAISPRTAVSINGEKASLGDLVAGSVAEVVADGKGRATLIRGYGGATFSLTTDRGTVIAIGGKTITLIVDGVSRTLAIDKATRFRAAGAPVRRNAVRPGTVVAVTHTVEGPALVVSILKRPGG